MWSYLWFWWKQSPAEAVHVAQVHLDAGVCEAQLMEAGGVVTGADVALTREWRDGDCVLQLRLRQIVANPTIHITLKTQHQKEVIHRTLMSRLKQFAIVSQQNYKCMSITDVVKTWVFFSCTMVTGSTSTQSSLCLHLCASCYEQLVLSCDYSHPLPQRELSE